MSKNREADSPSTVSVLLFSLLLAVGLAIGAMVNVDVKPSLERTDCPERFVPQGHLYSETSVHRTPINQIRN